MRLHRSEPPRQNLGDRVTIGSAFDAPVYLYTEPREIAWDSDADPLREFFPAFAKASARIWGQHWHAPLELCCGLRKHSAKRWMESQTIPPPRIVAWIAYISSHEDARAIGRSMEAIAVARSENFERIARAAYGAINGNR